MPDKRNISVTAATGLAVSAFENAGMSAGDAAAAAWPLVEAEAMGIPTHGLIRVPIYVERMRLGGIDPRASPVVERRAAALALVDGANACGTLVAARALDAGLELAADSGIAYVGCRRSNHCGALAPYGLAACDAGFLLLAGTGASPSMPPWGGSEARIGNNPLCIAAPIGGGPHFLLDMAMSVAARGKIRAARDAGRPIPADWAVDAEGRPTTDPLAALAGFLAPMGAHKGSGLSLGIDILGGVLAGAQFLNAIPSWMENPQLPSVLGHFFILIDPARLIGADDYAVAMERFRETLLSTPAADAARPVQLPGQAHQARRALVLRDGLDLPSALADEIGRLGAG